MSGEPLQVRIVRSSITKADLSALAERSFGDLVKAVVDVGRHLMAVGGGMHSDEESVLLDDGGDQSDLWGINIYPSQCGTEEWIEFDSMINIRPRANNRSRDVEDPDTRRAIIRIVRELVRSDD